MSKNRKNYISSKSLHADRSVRVTRALKSAISRGLVGREESKRARNVKSLVATPGNIPTVNRKNRIKY